MKRIITLALALTALILLLTSAMLDMKRYATVSEVYLHYKDRADLKVGFVKDYRVDDSTTVDVTTLTAKDSASWEALLREMNCQESVIEQMRDAVNDGRYLLNNYYCEIGHPEHRIPFNDDGCWMVYCNPTEKTIYIFHIINSQQGYLIIRSKVRELRVKVKKQ